MYSKLIDGIAAIANTQIDDTWTEVTNFAPPDRAFRNAWVFENGTVAEEIVMTKALAHDKRRARRDELFAPHDEIIMKQIPGQSAQQAEQARADIRSQDALVQESIDLASDTQAIRDALVAYGVQL